MAAITITPATEVGGLDSDSDVIVKPATEVGSLTTG
jgi:hypothetical protein